jgi:iron(III) transport system permease protein
MLGRNVLDTFVFLPHAIPGIVLGLAFIMAFLTFPLNQLGIYGTVWIIVLALVTQYVAFGTRVMNGAILQIHKELEEAAYVSKASPFKTVLKITLPLLFPAFASAWIWSAVTSMRAFAIPLMLASRKSQVISVMMWGYWDDGYVSMAATLGVMLILVLIPVTLLLRRFIVQVSGQGT